MSNSKLKNFVGQKNCHITDKELRIAESAVQRWLDEIFGDNKGDMHYLKEISIAYESKEHLHYPYQTRPKLYIDIILNYPVKGTTRTGSIVEFDHIQFDIEKRSGYFRGEFNGETYPKIKTDLKSWDCSIRLPDGHERGKGCRHIYIAEPPNHYEYGLSPNDWEFHEAVEWIQYIIEHPTNKQVKTKGAFQ